MLSWCLFPSPNCQLESEFFLRQLSWRIVSILDSYPSELLEGSGENGNIGSSLREKMYFFLPPSQPASSLNKKYGAAAFSMTVQDPRRR